MGTTGDPDQARRDFSRFYPYNLCVQQVRYSRADLDAVVAGLRARLRVIDATVDPTSDRVMVRTAAYDAATRDAVQAVGPARITVTSLLRPVN